jgi:hypothetical protein
MKLVGWLGADRLCKRQTRWHRVNGEDVFGFHGDRGYERAEADGAAANQYHGGFGALGGRELGEAIGGGEVATTRRYQYWCF